MKTFYLMLLMFGTSLTGFAQFEDFPDREENLRLLIKDTAILNKVKRGIYNHPALEIAAKTPLSVSTVRNYPIRIAIDPGHIASNKKEALLEERYINSEHGFFYESELNMATALELKKLLTERGFIVMLTREEGKTAFGVSYSDWYRKEFKKCVKADLDRKLITEDQYQTLLRSSKQDVFNKYFKNKDFTERIDKINAFQPDLTLIIHYNVSEFENSPEHFCPTVDYNYSVSFVPGGFTGTELQYERQLNDFIRLASTDVIRKSVMLSRFVNEEFSARLGTKNLTPEFLPGLWYLEKYSVFSNHPGVFARNLPMTRSVRSPLCYSESILQNSAAEIKGLAKRGFKVGRYNVSPRVKDVADCYYVSVNKYLQFVGLL